MSPFLIAFATVFAAEMGDRTQLLSLVLVARFRRPWPVLCGIFVATLANHAIAGAVGVWFGRFLSPILLDGAVGLSMIAMAIWSLFPDKADESADMKARGAFLATLTAFFIAEMGDKTQIATVALAAGYAGAVTWVIAGTTLGMLAANAPVVLLGNAFASRLPMAALHRAAAILFLALGLYFIGHALMQGTAR